MDETEQLEPETIEEWLGVEPGGALTCGISRANVSAVLIGALALVLLTVVCLTRWPDSAAPLGALAVGLVGSWAVGALLTLECLCISARRIRADARGLSVRQRGRHDHFAWSEITAVRARERGWIISTERGDVMYAGITGDHLTVIDTIRRVLAARDAGLTLPSDGPVPDVALSRMTGDEGAEVDRGLSVTRDEPE